MVLTLTVSLKLPHIVLRAINVATDFMSILSTYQLQRLMVGLNKQFLSE